MNYRTFFSAAALFALPLFSTLGQANEPMLPPLPVFDRGAKLYAGAALSHNGHSDVCKDTFFSGSCHDGANSWKLYGGARINPMFGVEAAYADYGEGGKAGVTSDGKSVAMRNELTSLNTTAVGYLPIPTVPKLEALGKAGLAFWDRESSKTVGTTTEESNDDGTSLMMGLGAQYQVQPNLLIRGEWEHLFGAGSDEYETDLNSYSVGVMFQTL